MKKFFFAFLLAIPTLALADEDEPITLKSRLELVEKRIQNEVVRPFTEKFTGMGLSEKLDALAKLSGAKDGNGLLEKVAEVEKAMGIEANERTDLAARIDDLIESATQDYLAEQFEKIYGIPARMKIEERIAASEKFFNGRISGTSGDLNKIKLLQTRFPEVAGELGSLKRVVQIFEKEWKVTPKENQSLSGRIEALQTLGIQKRQERIVEERKSQSLEERVRVLLEASKELAR